MMVARQKESLIMSGCRCGPKGMMGARQQEILITAGEYDGRGGHYEPKRMIGPGRKKASLQQTSIRGGVVIGNLTG